MPLYKGFVEYVVRKQIQVQAESPSDAFNKMETISKMFIHNLEMIDDVSVSGNPLITLNTDGE